MAKSPTYPYLFDRHAQRLTIRDLGRMEALRVSGGPARVEIRLDNEGRTETQTIEIVGSPMRFGGYRFYFVCPVTGKRCQTLYRFKNRLGGRFAHRLAFPDACYSIQTLSKTDRIFTAKNRTLSAIGRAGLKTIYDGRPTRRFLSLSRRLRKIEDAEREIFVSFVSRWI